LCLYKRSAYNLHGIITTDRYDTNVTFIFTPYKVLFLVKTRNESCNFTPSIKHSGFSFHWKFYQEGSDYMTQTISVYVVVYMNTAHEISFSIPSTWLQFRSRQHISTKLTPTHYLSSHRGILKVCHSFQPAMTKYQ